MARNNNVESTWEALYIVGGAAALIAVIVFRRNLGAEMVAFEGFGIFDIPAEEPISALEWFVVFQEDWFVGLAYFNFIDLVNYALVGLIFLALYGALRQVSRGAMLAVIVIGFVGIAVSFATSQALSMLALSNRYAAAATEAQRTTLLAAGEALLAIDNPGAAFKGTGYYLSLFLVLTAGLIISIVMLRSTVFPRATAAMGILANGIALGYFIALLVAPAWIWLPPTVSALFRLAWYILIAVGLFRLAKRTTKESQDLAPSNSNRD